MDRKDIIRSSIKREELGIEIAPYFSPLTSRRDGYNCLTLDVFDQRELRSRAHNDNQIPNDDITLIEDVDFVGTASEIASLVAQKWPLKSFDYIISSHNFEHIPDPIKFLQGCSQVLKAGGRLVMALPDKRVCFDYFRPESTFADWLDAYENHSSRPSNAQVFRHKSMQSLLYIKPEGVGAFFLHDDPLKLGFTGDVTDIYEEWLSNSRRSSEDYQDAHCWTFTPSSFELLVREAAYLGLVNMSIAAVSDPNGHEFYAELINTPWDQKSKDEFHRVRRDLLLKIKDELAENSPLVFRQRATISALQAKVDLVRRRPFQTLWHRLTGRF